MIPQLLQAGYVISYMEAAKLENDGIERADTQFALMGLLKNGDDDWFSHHDPSRIIPATRSNLQEAIESEHDYIFRVWIDTIDA
jgi:hypothetical protein